MAVNYSATLKSTRMQAVINAIDANAAPGFIQIGTSGMGTLLASITLQKPSFSEAGGTITMLGVPKSGIATASGIAGNAIIKDGGGNTVVGGLTVGVSGADINLSSISIITGQTVALTAGTISHAP